MARTLIVFLSGSLLLAMYEKRIGYRQSEHEAFKFLARDLARLFHVSPRLAELRLEHIGFEGLPDMELKKPDPWSTFTVPYREPRMTAQERKEEKAIASYDKYLDPNYINR